MAVDSAVPLSGADLAGTEKIEKIVDSVVDVGSPWNPKLGLKLPAKRAVDSVEAVGSP